MITLRFDEEGLLADLSGFRDGGCSRLSIMPNIGLTMLHRDMEGQAGEMVTQPDEAGIQSLMDLLAGDDAGAILSRGLSSDGFGAIQSEWRGFSFVIHRSLFGISIEIDLQHKEGESCV